MQTLANKAKERFTGSSSTTIPLTQAPQVGIELVYKNGVLLDPLASTPDYVIIGKTLTLHTRSSGDVIYVHYEYSTGQQ